MSRLLTLLTALAAANGLLTAIVVLLPSTIFSPNEYANWRTVHDFSAPETVSIVLGDSRARAGVTAPALGEGWRNVSLGGATPVEVKLLYDNHVHKWPSLDTVLIAFAGFHLEFPDTFERRALQYNQFSIEQILTLRAQARAPEHRDTGGQAFLDASEDWLGYTLRLWPLYAAEIRDGWVENAMRDPLHPFSQMDAQYQELRAQYEQAAGWEARTGSIADIPERRSPSGEGLAAFKPNSLINAYLEELVATASARARLVVLASPPHSPLTADNPLAERYWTDVQNTLCAVAAKHENVLVMPIETFDERHFNDPSHLNEEGARLWTAQIAGFLEEPSQTCAGLIAME